MNLVSELHFFAVFFEIYHVIMSNLLNFMFIPFKKIFFQVSTETYITKAQKWTNFRIDTKKINSNKKILVAMINTT